MNNIAYSNVLFTLYKEYYDHIANYVTFLKQ